VASDREIEMTVEDFKDDPDPQTMAEDLKLLEGHPFLGPAELVKAEQTLERLRNGNSNALIDIDTAGSIAAGDEEDDKLAAAVEVDPDVQTALPGHKKCKEKQNSDATKTRRKQKRKGSKKRKKHKRPLVEPERAKKRRKDGPRSKSDGERKIGLPVSWQIGMAIGATVTILESSGARG